MTNNQQAQGFGATKKWEQPVQFQHKGRKEKKSSFNNWGIFEAVL